MTKLIFSGAFESLQSQQSYRVSRRQFNQQALDRRLDWVGSRLNGARTTALASPPQHLDERLLADGAALEAAWQTELKAMIAVKRSKTSEARAIAEAARAATALVVVRIETARALTLDGLKVQARAALWRRDGAPLGPDIPDDQGDDAWSDMADLPKW